MSTRTAGWFWPAVVSLFAFILRIWHVGSPKFLAFDERYYAENAWSMLKVGYAQDYIHGAEAKIAAGRSAGLFVLDQPTQVVHPDAAKWLIALGESIFGLTPFGWRIASVVAGTLTVLVLCRLVLRLTGSVRFGCLAGFLLAIDGMHLTTSRLALLDVFVTLWIVCGVACLAADRDWVAARLDGTHRWRPWQLTAGVCFGLACGSKWNGLYALAAFGITIVVWELFLRRSFRPVLKVGVPAFGRIVGVAAAVYLFTCLGWLVNHEVYEQRFGHGYGAEKAWGAYIDQPMHDPVDHASHALQSLWHYQGMSYRFHTGSYLAKQKHPYQSDALGWLVQARPVSAAVRTTSCCMREVLMLGNPVIWWSGIVALITCVGLWIRTRHWTYSVAIVGVMATWAPWLPVQGRPIFAFYATATIPFTITAIALTLHAMWTNAQSRVGRIAVGSTIVTVLSAAAVMTIFFWPIWTFQTISTEAWQARMWFRSWV